MTKKNKKDLGPVSKIHSGFMTVVSIALVLYLLGILGLTGLFGHRFSDNIRENISFSVMLTEGVSEKEVDHIEKEFASYPFVRSTKYISKKDALNELVKEIGEDPQDFLGYNPLHPSIEVKFRSEYLNPDSLSYIEKVFHKNPMVDEMLYKKDILSKVYQNFKKITYILFGLAVLLFLICIAQINSTIRLLIYSRRFIINTMTLVGAKPSFIRAPIIRFNMINGLIASVIACVMVVGSIFVLYKQLPILRGILSWFDIGVILIGIFLVSLVISISASYISSNRFIKMNVSKMYRI